MSRALGFDLVLSRGDLRVGRRGFDDLVIRQHVGLDGLGEDFGIQSAEERRDLIEKRLHPLSAAAELMALRISCCVLLLTPIRLISLPMTMASRGLSEQ